MIIESFSGASISSVSHNTLSSDITTQNLQQYKNLDWTLITEVSGILDKDLNERFQRGIETDPIRRPLQSFLGLHAQKRQGPIERGIDPNEVQSLLEHALNTSKIIMRAYKLGLLDDLLKDEPDPIQVIRGARHKARFHDLPEEYITDMTPKDLIKIGTHFLKKEGAKENSITPDLAKTKGKEVKDKLEHMAAEIMFEVWPDRYQDFLDYEAKRDVDDLIVKMSDGHEWILECAAIHTGPDSNNNIEPFADLKILTAESMGGYPSPAADFGYGVLDRIEEVFEVCGDILRGEGERKERYGHVMDLAFG